MPNIWGAHQGLLEGLSLLGPPSCPASWPASLVKRVTAVPTLKAALVVPPTPVTSNTPSEPSKGKLPPGSSGKKSGPLKQVTDYWKDLERKKKDEESHKWEEEKCRKKPSGPVLSLAERKEPVTSLTSKAAMSRVSQPPSLPTQTPSVSQKGQGKVRRDSPTPFDLSDDEPLFDKVGEPEPKSHKRDPASPELMILDDDDHPLPCKSKGPGRKPSPRAYT